MLSMYCDNNIGDVFMMPPAACVIDVIVYFVLMHLSSTLEMLRFFTITYD